MLGDFMGAPEKDGIAAEVLHEIKQPLLGLKAYLQMVRDEPNRPIPVTLLLAQVERIEQIVGDFHRLTNDRPAPLTQLKLSGLLERASGVVFGELPRCDEPAPGGPAIKAVVADLLADFRGPVLFGLPSGHTDGACMTLPFGVRARLISRPAPALIIEEKAVA